MAATGPIATFAAPTAGSGYVSGVYKNVALSGGSGVGATAHITVAGGAVTAVTLPHPSTPLQLERVGKNYQVGDVLGADAGFDGAGSGTGFAVNVATLAKACENCFFGKAVPPSAGAALFGQRFCGNSDYSSDNKLFALKLLGQQGYANNSSLVSPSFEGLITQDDFFCGDGADLATGVSFSSTIGSLPASTVPSFSWSTFAPSIAVSVGSFTSEALIYARYVLLGKICLFELEFDVTTNGTAAGVISFNLPIRASQQYGTLGGYDRTQKIVLVGNVENFATGVISANAGGYPCVDGSKIMFGGTYEIP